MALLAALAVGAALAVLLAEGSERDPSLIRTSPAEAAQGPTPATRPDRCGRKAARKGWKPKRLRECRRRAHRVPAGFFGINGQFMRSDEIDRGKHLDEVAGAGLKEVRYSGLWHTIERKPPRRPVGHTYDWRAQDRVVKMLARRGLRMYSLLSYGASWASIRRLARRQAWRYPPRPEYHGAWARWAGATARRYGRNGTFWRQNPKLPYRPVRSYEIWNEVNHSYFSFAKRPGEYAALYLRAHEEIKKVDPKARVVFAAHAFSNLERWLGAVVAARPELRKKVKVAGIHLYGGSYRGAIKKLAGFRSIVDRFLGRRVELDITEDGINQSPGSRPIRRDYLKRFPRVLPRSGCRVSNYLLHTWWTPQRNPRLRSDWWGVANRNASLQPDGNAFRNSVRLMRGLAKRPPPHRPAPICRR